MSSITKEEWHLWLCSKETKDFIASLGDLENELLESGLKGSMEHRCECSGGVMAVRMIRDKLFEMKEVKKNA